MRWTSVAEKAAELKPRFDKIAQRNGWTNAEVIQQLDTEPGIACVVMGAGLDDTVRGDLVGVIAARRPDITIHLKDRASGPDGLLPFTRRVVEAMVLSKVLGERV